MHAHNVFMSYEKTVYAMSLIYGIIIGAVAGILAQKIMSEDAPYGIIGDIVLGIIGGAVGSYLLGLIGLGGSGIIGSLVVSVIGAVALIYLLRKIG